MGKQFTATAVMMLVEEGKLSLADPITSSHLPFRFVFTLSAGGSLATIDRATMVRNITDSCVGPNLCFTARNRRSAW